MLVFAPTHIPYCSCIGMNQHCYKWGSGGWQSACCTTLLSLHPLPMNPKKNGSRVVGRKMSVRAFDKLLKKLKLEGVDVSYYVDSKIIGQNMVLTAMSHCGKMACLKDFIID